MNFKPTKKKFIFLTLLLFICEVNFVNAEELSQWGRLAIPEGEPEKDFRLFMINDVFSVVSILFLLFLSISIGSSLYLFIRKNQKFNKVKSFSIIITVIMFIILLLIMPLLTAPPLNSN